MANVKDGATSTVATAPSPATSGTSLVVQSGEGARFPSPPFYAIVHPASSLPVTSNAEKVLVTAVSTDTFTIVRAQGIYTAKSIATGWRISNAIFQEDINNSSIIQNEVPGGSINSSNTAFTLASAAGMVTGSLKLFKNGIRLKATDDYTETSTGFTMVTAPATGTKLLADYNVNGALNNTGTNSIIVGEVPSGSINGTNAVFTLARSYIAGSVDVKVNGLSQARTTHFSETSPSLGTITLSDAPSTGDIVTVDYMYNLNPSGNADTVDGIHANSTPTANQLVPLDGNGIMPFAALGGAWSSWTPTYTNLTVGNGTVQCGYIQIGKTVHFRWVFQLGSSSAVSGAVSMTLPVTARGVYTAGAVPEMSDIGFAKFLDSGVINIKGTTTLTSTTTVSLQPVQASGSYSQASNTSSTLPFTWGNGDAMFAEGTYEAA